MTFKYFIFFVASFQLFSQSGHFDAGSGNYAQDRVFDGSVIRYCHGLKIHQRLPLPALEKYSNSGAVHYWDGVNIYKIYNSEKENHDSIVQLEMGFVAAGKDPAKQWIWFPSLELPPRSEIVLAFNKTVLIVFPLRETQNNKLIRKRIFAQVDVLGRTFKPIETISLAPDDYFDSEHIQIDECGYVFLNDGRLLKWDSSNASLEPCVSDMFDTLESHLPSKPFQAFPKEPYPAFAKATFLDKDGCVYFSVNILVKTNKAHLMEHYVTMSKNDRDIIDKQGFSKLPDGPVKGGHAVTRILKFHPRKKSVELLPYDLMEGLFDPKQGPPCSFSEKVGDFLYADDQGRIRFLTSGRDRVDQTLEPDSPREAEPTPQAVR